MPQVIQTPELTEREKLAKLEKIPDYIKNGRLEEKKLFLMSIANTTEFMSSTLYDIDILKIHVGHMASFNNENMYSMICRCVENGFIPQLHLFISKLTEINNNLLKNLCLRKIDIATYKIVKTHGFIDIEVEKRIALFQRVWRARKVGEVVNKGIPKYEGPCIISDEPRMYWRYRHSVYFIRWNKTKRYQLVKKLQREWWGDENHSAYYDIDDIEKKDQSYKKYWCRTGDLIC